MTEMRSAGTLGDLLASRRRRRFVGRASEVELFRVALESPEPPFLLLHLHGPPGIGKTSLLDVYAGLAADAGATRGPSGRARPRPVAAGRAAGPGGGARGARRGRTPSPDRPAAVVWWSCSTPMSGWRRWTTGSARVLLPRLPANAVTVFAGRERTGPGLARRPGVARAVAGGVAAQPEPGRQPPVPARLWRRPGPSRSAGRAGPWPPAGAVAAGRCVRSGRRSCRPIR